MNAVRFDPFWVQIKPFQTILNGNADNFTCIKTNGLIWFNYFTIYFLFFYFLVQPYSIVHLWGGGKSHVVDRDRLVNLVLKLGQLVSLPTLLLQVPSLQSVLLYRERIKEGKNKELLLLRNNFFLIFINNLLTQPVPNRLFKFRTFGLSGGHWFVWLSSFCIWAFVEKLEVE